MRRKVSLAPLSCYTTTNGRMVENADNDAALFFTSTYRVRATDATEPTIIYQVVSILGKGATKNLLNGAPEIRSGTVTGSIKKHHVLDQRTNYRCQQKRRYYSKCSSASCLFNYDFVSMTAKP